MNTPLALFSLVITGDNDTMSAVFSCPQRKAHNSFVKELARKKAIVALLNIRTYATPYPGWTTPSEEEIRRFEDRGVAINQFGIHC
jgi:hypothetical protein